MRSIIVIDHNYLAKLQRSMVAFASRSARGLGGRGRGQDRKRIAWAGRYLCRWCHGDRRA
ncbi:hypothetical protein CAI18_04150 [Xanthomonas citri pv. punicae]|nr:hypothetical protein CAI14_17015 [Xanthomonas citri pv. punicae]QCZ69710.1 hypothetical protein CAI17_14650 [Xanthomonas citri pv. punicae]QCZ73754.1 hypothetical protein CAB38_14640 [Xanthomonas citri pv. punicae]QCZ75803.1 hypothetical protein XapA_02125 [Xanthomonas citri pv. punicae]QCZ80507.1 hypothetical protein XapB_05620 [Xanthomonas citri pv. punicae]